MEALAVSTKTAGYDTNHDTNAVAVRVPRLSCWENWWTWSGSTDDLFHAMEEA